VEGLDLSWVHEAKMLGKLVVAIFILRRGWLPAEWGKLYQCVFKAVLLENGLILENTIVDYNVARKTQIPLMITPATDSQCHLDDGAHPSFCCPKWYKAEVS